MFTTEAHFIYLPKKYLHKSTLSSKSSHTCPVYKLEPFKLEDRPPLITDIEISLLEAIVNSNQYLRKDQTPDSGRKLDLDVTLMYDFLHRLIFIYVAYNVCWAHR